ncbi:MATE family efflux transporter [Parasalinivibrio latis]|uniref:MATE family efflux transporter n=1 Tax=Parasalinivibrio latis TaxID=2952610 RepID=UPI0030E00076
MLQDESSLQREASPLVSDPVAPQFFRFAGHALTSLLAITTASLVDGFFVGNFVGSNALAAVTLLVPGLTLMFAVALTLAIGGAVKTGHWLGVGQIHQASRLFSASVISIFVFSCLTGIGVTVWDNGLYATLGAPEAVWPLMHEYVGVMRFALVVQLCTLVMYYFIRADNQPQIGTQALLTGALVNIVLNALFVGWLGLGLAGAAWATLLAQCIQLAVISRYFTRPDRNLHWRLDRFPYKLITASVKNGFSEGINELSIGLVIGVVNWLMLKTAGAAGVAAFSVVNFLLFTASMTFYGIIDAVHPLVSYNTGAGRYDRVRSVVIIALVTLGVLASVMMLATWIFADSIPAIFLNQDDVNAKAIAAGYLSFIWPVFLLSSLNMLISSVLTATDYPKPSAVIACARGFIFPVSLLLIIGFYIPGIPLLAALPMAEFITFILATVLAIKTLNSAKLSAKLQSCSD